MTATALRAGVVAQLAPKLLTPDPDNPRKFYDDAALDALADNVKARGILSPILVRKGPKGALIVKDGHRRLRAAKLAKLKAVPVLLAGDDELTDVRLDQVAVNNLHERLAPMDTARMLRKLRDEQKLTPNDLAARMAKAGTPMSTAEIERAIALSDLPDWAQGMIDAGELAPEAGHDVLPALRDVRVAKKLHSALRQAFGWRGRVDTRLARDVIEGIYQEVGVDLNCFWGRDDRTVHFDWKSRCKGCEHLRRLQGIAVCMDAKAFAQHNAEAKAAGLGPGGKKPEKAAKPDPEKLTPKQAAKLEAEKAERREKVEGSRAEGYLDQWLRGKVATQLLNRPAVALSLVAWLASDRPDAGLVGNAYIPGEWRHKSGLRTASGRKPRLDAFLESPPSQVELVSLAIGGIPLIAAPQIRELAGKLGISLEVDWRADGEYLRLRSREQLVEWLKAYGLDAGGKVGELRQRLLDHPHTLEYSAKLPHMAALHEAYAAPVRDEAAAAEQIAAQEDDYDPDWDDDHATGDDEDDDPPHGHGEDTDVEDRS